MDAITVSRFILPVIAVLIFLIIAKITKAPRPIIKKSLSICWVAGLLAIVSYIIGMKMGFWHYTMKYLFFGLPLDRFLAASIAYGAGLGLIYWRLKVKRSKYLLPFILIIPIYGLLTDYIGTKMTGTAFWSVDHPAWYIADLVAWIFCWAVMVVLFQRNS